MDKDALTKDILLGLTVKELQEKYNCSRSKVYYYKKLYNLNGLSPNSKKSFRNTGIKTCTVCNEQKTLENFYSNGFSSAGTRKYKAACSTCEMKKRSNNFYNYISEYLNISNKEYRCCKCGYTNIFGALDFHHRDPKLKDFEVSEANKSMSFDTFMDTIAPEIDKCDILCPNCHRLEHLKMG